MFSHVHQQLLGANIKRGWITIEESLFYHDQLYVAALSVGAPNNLYMYTQHEKTNKIIQDDLLWSACISFLNWFLYSIVQ